MNPRLAKELRPLLLPWIVAAGLGLGNLLGLFSRGAFADFLMGLPGLAFVVGCLFLAAWPMGAEFQQRTWPLLLGQPQERSRLWREKMLASLLSIAALTVVYLATIIAQGTRVPLEELLPWVGFIVATVCSAAVCTLGARSVLGGMVFIGACQFAATLVVTGVIYACYKMLGRNPDDPAMAHWPIITAYISAGAVYSAFTLWLGWRKFAELEVRDAPEWQPVSLPDWVTPKRLAALLRCQPAGKLSNLIRKELGLQKPVLVIAVVTSACWMLTLVLFMLQPSRAQTFEAVFAGLTVAQMVLTVLLAGCVSLGEEKTLGVAAWHLTLPVSARRQWLVKLLVSAATAIVIGLALPLAWSGIALVRAKVGLLTMGANATGMSAGCLMILFVMSFWSAALFGSAVRAAFGAVLSLIGIASSVGLAVWVSELLGAAGLLSDLITGILARRQLPPGFFSAHDAAMPYSVLLAVFAVLLTALVQSFAHFRRVQVRSIGIFRSSLVLAIVVFASAFWCADLVKSMGSQNGLAWGDLAGAFRELPQITTKIASGQPWVVTPQELEQTGKLSGRAKVWLRNSTIMVYPRGWGSVAEIHLPDQEPLQIPLSFSGRPEKPPLKPQPPK